MSQYFENKNEEPKIQSMNGFKQKLSRDGVDVRSRHVK